MTNHSFAIPPIGLAPFLTFAGQAEAAMDHYQDVFKGSQRLNLTLIENDLAFKAAGKDVGKVLNGQLLIKGQLVMFMDIAPEYAVPFNWASSLYIHCDSEEEFDSLFAGLSSGGTVMMGPEKVLDLHKGAWVTDRFGVTWQLVLE